MISGPFEWIIVLNDIQLFLINGWTNHFVSAIISLAQLICGALVKRLRRRPLTAESGVRFPNALPRQVFRMIPKGFFIISAQWYNECRSNMKSDVGIDKGDIDGS